MDPTRWKEVKTAFDAAIECSNGEAESILSRLTPEVRDEVGKLLANYDKAEGFLGVPAFDRLGSRSPDLTGQHAAGTAIDDYLIVDEIGQGGMGVVFLAEQQAAEFSHRVALKLIKRGMDTNAVLARFVRERQILANLAHANIARFLDGGSTTDGLPYFVMEYVDGKSITEFSHAKGLDTKERLKLFRKVCDAVSFAHQNLTVHRDLKPSNILVTEDGEPKLLDFGIAKMLNPDTPDDGDEATATMFRVMTPDYASPEQLRGERVTTASDVYSLGIVLYELLAGRRPYKFATRAPDELARELSTHEPLKPSSVVNGSADHRSTGQVEAPPTKETPSGVSNPRSLVGDLDNIVLKAIQREPSRRYASVAELSEDIRRHLAGLPVTATADSISYRAAKFVRRHMAGVAAAALIALTLVSATSITAWQAYRAERERAKAEERFKQVRRLANLVMFEYHDGIEKLAGSTAVREKMVKDAVIYLDSLLNESPGDPELLGEMAAGYQKVGDVQGNPYVPNLGDQDGALLSYQKANVIRADLARISPADRKAAMALELTHEKLGEIYWAKGDNDAARANFENALAICRRLEEEEPMEAADLYAFVRLSGRLGTVFEQIHDYDASIKQYRSAIDYGQRVVGLEPGNARYRRGLAVSYLKVGDILHLSRRFAEALESFKVGLATFEELSRADETNATLQRDTALCLGRLGAAQVELADYESALVTNRRTVEVEEKLILADPNNLQVRFDLADVYMNLGDNLARMDRSAEAESVFTRAMAIYVENIAKNPDFAQSKSHYGHALQIVGSFHLKRGDHTVAIQFFRRSLELLETAKDLPEALAEAYEGIGDALYSQGTHARDLQEVREMYQKGLSMWQQLRDAGKLADDKTAKIDILQDKLAKVSA